MSPPKILDEVSLLNSVTNGKRLAPMNSLIDLTSSESFNSALPSSNYKAEAAKYLIGRSSINSTAILPGIAIDSYSQSSNIPLNGTSMHTQQRLVKRLLCHFPDHTKNKQTTQISSIQHTFLKRTTASSSNLYSLNSASALVMPNTISSVLPATSKKACAPSDV